MNNSSFKTQQKVLFKHCDPAGIVFYPRYIEMINDCVESYFDAIGHPFESILKDSGVPTVSLDVQFKHPSFHGEHLSIELDCLHVGNSSVKLQVQAKVNEQQRFIAQLVLVRVNSERLSAKWPDSLKNALLSSVNTE